jgi:AraC-like DNA-binding protein
MPQTNEVFFAFIFFTALLGLLVAAILFFVNKNQTLAPRLLAIYVLFFSLTILHTGLSFTTFYLNHPQFWRSTALTTFCAPVIMYLYVRSALYQSFRLKKTDWLLFIPAFLYLLVLLPYYLSPVSEKLIIVSNFMADKSLIAKEPEVMLPQGWGVLARCILGLSLLSGQFIMLFKMRHRLFQDSKVIKQNQTTYRWLFSLTSLLAIFYLMLTIEHVIHLKNIRELSSMIFLTMTATIFFISTYLLLRPNLLYGIQGWLHAPMESSQISKGESQTLVTPPLDEKRPYLTPEQGMLYKMTLESHFTSRQPFLRPGYRIKDLCEELNIPVYQLSAFINQEYGKNFNELINGYRVAYIAGLLKESSKYQQFTLEALSGMAGFNSRNSFFNAVKKISGQTPAEYYGTKSSSKPNHFVPISKI